MKIFVLGVENMIGELLVEKLREQKHDISVLTEDTTLFEKYQKSEVLAIQGSAQENGRWIELLPSELDYIVNFSYPKLPEHLSLKQVENGAAEHMLRIGQNLSYVATKKKARRIFQMANIFYYQVTGETQLSERSPRDLAPENYGAIYSGVLGHFLSQKELPSTILISGHFIYNSEGQIFPLVPTLMHSSFVIPGVDTKLLQLTHVEDYVGALIHLMTTNADLPIVNVVDNSPVAQKQFFGIVGNILKQRQTLVLPEAIVSVICGDLYTKSLLRTVTAKNDLLKSTGYWLKYPDYKAGFAKYIMSL